MVSRCLWPCTLCGGWRRQLKEASWPNSPVSSHLTKLLLPELHAGMGSHLADGEPGRASLRTPPRGYPLGYKPLCSSWWSRAPHHWCCWQPSAGMRAHTQRRVAGIPPQPSARRCCEPHAWFFWLNY